MIFSHPGLAAFLSERFECAWESVRPVPQVEIDFGNGRRVRRTLNGNVATYYCDPGGRVFDILPGIVTPLEYVSRARLALALHDRLRREANPAAWVTRYQRGRARCEPGPLNPATGRLVASLRGAAPLLRQDTAFNRAHRYPRARRLLAARPLATPGELREQVYRELLGTDLTDPYLGLAAYVEEDAVRFPPWQATPAGARRVLQGK